MLFLSTRARRSAPRPISWSVLAVLALFLPAISRAQSPGSCRRIALDPAPAWSPSAAWSPDGRELVLLDIVGARLLRYRDGKPSGIVVSPGRAELEFNDPIDLSTIPGGFLLTNYPGKLIWLDPGFHPSKALDFLRVKAKIHLHEHDNVERFSLNSPRLVSDSVIGFAILHLNDTPWEGFVRSTLKPFLLTDLIEEIQPKAPEDRLFRLLGQGTALAAGGDYALRWAQTTYILQLWPQTHRLKAFPAGFEALPKLPEGVGGMAGGPILYKALEHSTSADRLYGQGAYLYLLTRKPTGQGPLWQLWQIDPQRDAVLRSMTLPTHASHILLAPGQVDWAVIEKGPVIEEGKQAIKSMLLIPSSWIEDPTSEALADGKAVSCP